MPATRSTHAHTLLALAAATANNVNEVKQQERKRELGQRERKAIAKKVRTGKVQRAIRRAVRQLLRIQTTDDIDALTHFLRL